MRTEALLCAPFQLCICQYCVNGLGPPEAESVSVHQRHDGNRTRERVKSRFCFQIGYPIEYIPLVDEPSGSTHPADWPAADLAVLKVAASNHDYLPMGSSTDAREGLDPH
jgi:hypothetical protein